MARLFDPAVFDNTVFDTANRQYVTITEQEQVFDETIVDSAIFDTNPGGVITPTDTVARQ